MPPKGHLRKRHLHTSPDKQWSADLLGVRYVVSIKSTSWSCELSLLICNPCFRSSAKPNRKRTLTISTTSAFFFLLTARCLSVVFNIIHDCDEVFNYWEPLHYLLYGYGLQTWEYRLVLSCMTCKCRCDALAGM